MSEKLYRRKPTKYEVIDRKWDASGEPYVLLLSVPRPSPSGGREADAVRASWEEFKDEFVEVRDEPAKPTAEAELDGLAESIDLLTCKLKGHADEKAIDPGQPLTVRHLRIILDAARKSLVDAEPAERCRRGEWIPGNRIDQPEFDFVCCAEVIDAGRRLRLRPCSKDGLGQSQYIDVADWDAARDEWIADGRPTS